MIVHFSIARDRVTTDVVDVVVNQRIRKIDVDNKVPPSVGVRLLAMGDLIDHPASVGSPVPKPVNSRLKLACDLPNAICNFDHGICGGRPSVEPAAQTDIFGTRTSKAKYPITSIQINHGAPRFRWTDLLLLHTDRVARTSGAALI
jgi:hypothetical protein